MPLVLLFCAFLCFQCTWSYDVITADASTNQYGELFEELESVLKTDLKPFVESQGYKFEKVSVNTQDGYILELHHVYLSNKSTTPVLIMPGLLCSSAHFLITGKNRSLAMRLADQGYDVWIGNNRGTTCSRKHKSLDPVKDKEKFWDFSFHEMGYYDLPACIDYILNRTKATNLSYIGHSQGTTQYFVMASTRPEYDSKINVMVALGPVAFVTHMSQPIFQFLKYHIILVEWIQKRLGIQEFLGHLPLITVLGKVLCTDGSKYQWVCELILSFITGFDIAELDTKLLPTIMETFPAGCSMKQLKHYLQEINSGHFRQYDYGVLRNLEVYNQSSPPDYDVSKITSPVAMLYGLNDWIIAPEDVEALAKNLTNAAVRLHKIEKPSFNHADFIFAKENDALVNFEVINVLNEYHGRAIITTTTTPSPTRPPSTKRPNSGPRTTESEYTDHTPEPEPEPVPPVTTSTVPPHTGSASRLLVGLSSKILVAFVMLSKLINFA